MGTGGRETCTAQPESEGVCMGVGGGNHEKDRGVDQMSTYIEDNGGQVSNSWKGRKLE